MQHLLSTITLGALSLAACTPPPLPVLVPEIHGGPGAAARPEKILVLGASCGSLEYHCPTELTTAADAIVRGGFEFAGFAVVDSDQLRATNRARHEEHRDEEQTTHSLSHTDDEHDLSPFDRHVTSTTSTTARDHSDLVVLDGPSFEDLSVEERRALFARSGADAVAKVRVVIGGTHGTMWSPEQPIETIVTLWVDRGETMAWAARCTTTAGRFQTITSALEHVTRCAIDGVSGVSER
jgi:hypothetical protein